MFPPFIITKYCRRKRFFSALAAESADEASLEMGFLEFRGKMLAVAVFASHAFLH